ncbi:MAG TPA: alanine racemase [Pseudolysinimonas sp.]|nr:alanine racemase [Pseudolysinimonas sp.]
MTRSNSAPAGDHLWREARIDLASIRSNVELLRDIVAPAQLMAVVKADAYGHGMVPAAIAALDGGADWLGVADIDEALALRSAEITAPILAWLHAPTTDFAPAVEAGIDLGVSSLDQLEQVAAAGPARVHLKLETGLSRNGASPEEAPAVFARAVELQRVGRLRVIGLFSHLSNTSLADDDAQQKLFDALVAEAWAAGLEPELRHLAATEAAIRRPQSRYELVRSGIGIYGLDPSPGVALSDLGLRPAMELSSAVAAVRQVPAGAGVSYGYTHRTDRPTTLVLVPLGYADGVPRAASGRVSVQIDGSLFPVVGRIAMDQFVVEVGDAPVNVGDRVVLWGDPASGAPSADDWADAAGTINYEIVTRVGPRVPRVPRA